MRILLVEDDADLRSEIREYLLRRGHEVTACGTVVDARSAVKSLVAAAMPPEATVCDVNLPDGDGMDFYAATATELADCRWILMSGAHDVERIELLNRRAGMPSCTIVEKPVSLRVLNGALAG